MNMPCFALLQHGRPWLVAASLVGVGLVPCAWADPPPLPNTEVDAVDAASYDADLESWVYGSRNWLRPGMHALTAVPRSTELMDARLSVRMNFGAFDADMRPRLVVERTQDGRDTATGITGSGFRLTLPQALARLKLGSTTVAAGREVLAWGPSSFRSPSNPFYFDAGRARPLELTSGIDLVRVTHQTNDYSLTSAYLYRDQDLDTRDEVRHAVLVKVDQQGDSHLVSLVGAWTQDPESRPNGFLGGFGQFSANDAWLIYGEGGFQQRQQGAPSARTLARAALAGAKYTTEGGTILNLEFLYNHNGKSPARAFTRLAGHHYVWLGWQSNPQETRLSWRTEYQANIDDRSGQLLCYIERNFAPRVNGFLSLAYNIGDNHSEYASIARGNVVLGIKVFGI